MKKNILAIVALTILVACENKTADTSRMKNEMEDRKIVRVTDGQLMEFAAELGKSIVDTLQTGITVSGISVTADTSMISRYASKSELDIQIKTREKIENPSKEYEVFDAYLYNVENKLPVEGNLQKVDNDFILYTHPVLSTDNSKLMAMWSVKMPRKQLIRKFASVNPVKN